MKTIKFLMFAFIAFALASCTKESGSSDRDDLLGVWEAISMNGVMTQKIETEDEDPVSMVVEFNAINIDYTIDFQEDKYIINGGYDLEVKQTIADFETTEVVTIPKFDNKVVAFEKLDDGVILLDADTFSTQSEYGTEGSYETKYKIEGDKLTLTLDHVAEFDYGDFGKISITNDQKVVFRRK